MATGLIAWTCLLLAPATPDEVFYMNHRGFQIPITVQPDKKAGLKELILWVSRDEGRTWEIGSRAQPDAKSFNFMAEKDGMVYFTIAVVDRSERMDPPDVYKAPVNQRIYIDTTRPTVRITAAERVGDEIQVNWEARDDKPEPTSLRLEWRSNAGSQWTPLPVLPDQRSTKLRPGVAGDVVLRLSMRDLAGNEASDEKTVGSATLTTSLDRGAAHGTVIPTGGQDLSPPPPLPTPGPAATAQPAAGRPPVEAAPYAPMPTRGQLPPLQIVNKKSLKLGFDVSKVGPSGLGTVDIYVTTDEGATWVQSKADPAVSLPVPADPRGAAGPQKGTVTVALPNDGVIYGFYLVVKSRAGLGKAAPKSGDKPQLRVEVDTTQPLAELYAPKPDNSRPNALLLTWKAEDRNLGTNNPISLEWSEQGRDWHPIGEPTLPNTGQFLWQVPANIPAKVLLKLTVRDTAGNVAVAQTTDPVLIDLAEPEVTGVSIAKQ